MDSQPFKPLKDHPPLAQKIAGEYGTRDVTATCGESFEDIRNQTIPQSYEDQNVTAGKTPDVFDQQLRSDGIDEFGEQNYQRSSPQACLQFSDTQREIGFLGGVGKRG